MKLISPQLASYHPEIINKYINNKHQRGYGGKVPLCCLAERELVYRMEQIIGFFRNLKLDLTYGPTVPLLGSYPKRKKSTYGIVIYSFIFKAAQ